MKWTPKFRQKNTKFANEFCTVQGSFRLVWKKFSRCCNTKGILSKYGWIHPYFETFPRKTFPFLIFQKSSPYNCYPNSCPSLTYFAVCYARRAYAEILAFGIASLDLNEVNALLHWEASQITLAAFLLFAKKIRTFRNGIGYNFSVV